MADDKVAIWGSGLKFGRKPANGELLIGNGQDMTMATLTAGAGASITNAAGAITISATGSGGTVTGVTASSPLASSGGATPNISLTGTVGVANGGTGLTAPGTSGNLLTSNGTAWTSSAPQWTRVAKTVNQTFSSTAYTDDSQLNFPVSANKVYILQIRCFVLTANTGGFKLAMTGPSSTNYVQIGLDGYNLFGTSFGDLIINTGNLGQGLVIPLIANISTGPNAGTIALRWAQAQGPSGTLTVYTGSWIEWAEVA
jgi:hypothetical protein